ncbi:cytochrome c1 [Rhodobium gokarnense]|uniref:Cytochrome c1 n=1 Tax=Rhodobium gokarnense TaxID=364296 RepID=A0ABT3H5Q4_9HYPH|nr:cytochrome c1 [Rhodobium gokarnense]MCW2305722.1 cytochrome c1 [Rhodobium gokarnense]
MKTMIKSTVAAACLASAFVLASVPASAAEEGHHLEQLSWSFSGPFGRYDQAQLQRGFKIYREVCSACHSMELVSFRNLSDPGGLGFTEEQVKALAEEYTIKDGPNEEGEMFERPGKPADKFPSPFPNVEAAKYANNGAHPPDFSLLAKARGPHRGFPWFLFDIFTQYQEGGPDYIHAILTGYEESPECGADFDGYYNTAFTVGGVPEGCKEGGQSTIAGTYIAMAPPLFDELVEYEDGTPTTVDQYAKDVAAFMMWAAEPKLEQRKRIGFMAMIYMIVLAGMLYFVKKKLWANIDH